MHVIFRESHGLDESETPIDLGQTPADMVALSFSDSDLGAFAAGWHRAAGGLPPLRLANLVALKHPLSVDTYIEQTLSGARAVLVRLIGGESYWPYGLASLQDLARRKGIALAVLPADGREDARLDALSTLSKSTLTRLKTLCDAGGAVAAQAALHALAQAANLPCVPVAGATETPEQSWYDPDLGPIDRPDAEIVVTFYRSYFVAADTAPIDALIAAFRAKGLRAYGLFAPSLKGPAAAWVAQELAAVAPKALVNATAFSAKSASGVTPLDAARCPVFQVALSTARRRDWASTERGLSPADLAMHVVLPEVDGRIFAGVISFKQPSKRDPALEFSRFSHRADPRQIAACVEKICRWVTLAQTPATARRIAIILSTYPGRPDQIAHAVGLDALASTERLLTDLASEGYDTAPQTDLANQLATARESWPLCAYESAISAELEPYSSLYAAWGSPAEDPLFADNSFQFPALRSGKILVALQPERGDLATRDDSYHDLSRTPRHSYVAFYRWLAAEKIDAIIHMGAHGTLEWLPGKSVALSETCWPETLTNHCPVIYPFIVNDPGEAAQAKRRIGAVTLGHMPPPLRQSALPETFAHLERLLDEYSTADGLDPARRDRLIERIREEARGRGLEADLGIPEGASSAEAITRIDRFVCDIKESQYGDGLHIYGQAAGETAGLRAALNGEFVAAGPAGSPYRGRTDVLPTGRNLFSVDPRAVPSRAAHAQGVKLAEELLRRHLQDHGDWPKNLVIDLWGSATMRTAGEEFAMALHLAGLAPRWDEGSERMSGFEIVPLALLGRPRIDITLRVSGLFRDVFPSLAQLFETGAEALAGRDEPLSENPYLARSARVFGPKPGLYGLAMSDALADYSDEAAQAAGEAWLKGSEWAIDAQGAIRQDRAALEARVLAADGFAHVQDLAESDLLLASDYAAHEGGFAAAKSALGGLKAALYHLDSTSSTPRARALTEEIARVVRARAAQPDWANGMMRHGFRGAAEITATLDHLGAFAHLTRDVPDHLIDLYFDATLGREDVAEFMARENPAALAALRARFAALHRAGLWKTRRNWIAAALEAQDE